MEREKPVGYSEADEAVRLDRMRVLDNIERSFPIRFSPELKAAAARYPRQRLTPEYIEQRGREAWREHRS